LGHPERPLEALQLLAYGRGGLRILDGDGAVPDRAVGPALPPAETMAAAALLDGALVAEGGIGLDRLHELEFGHDERLLVSRD
jgi:hypothetical protein